MRIATIILHYGDPKLTEKVYRTLCETTFCNNIVQPSIFVFDNASHIPYSNSWKRSSSNLYWAGALSYCFLLLKEMGFTHLWFLNNDITFIGNGEYLGKAYACIKRIEKVTGKLIGIWSPSMIYNSYHPQMCCRDNFSYSQVRLVDGVAALYNLTCLESIGGVDAADNLYGYGVDLWISIRANRKGWLLVVDHSMSIRHTQQATAKKIKDFIEIAACSEEAFLKKRLGTEWEKEIENMKQQYISVAL